MWDDVESRSRRTVRSAEPTWALWEVMRTANHAGHAMARRMDLPYNDMRALDALGDSTDGLGIVELAHRLGMRSASAAELVDRLESTGHVYRRRHDTDRRRVLVAPTEQGQAEALAAIRPLLDRFDRVAEELGEEVQALVAGYLRAIAAEQRAYCAEPEPS